MLKTGCIFVFFFIFLNSPTWGGVPKVKVLIGKSLKDVIVKGIDLRQAIPPKKIFRQFSGHQNINFTCRMSQKINSPQNEILIASLSSPTGLVSWEDKKFRGDLQLIADSKVKERGCDLVNLVSMDDYISSLLSKEMHPDWPLEALKAQAVVARSYAMAKMNKGKDKSLWDLESSERHQVSGTFFDTTARTDLAVKETLGEVLIDEQEKTVEAFFHSKCGGHTLRPDQVWTSKLNGYQNVECPFCHKYGRHPWSLGLARAKMGQMLSVVINKYQNKKSAIQADQLTFVYDSNRHSEIRFYNGNQFFSIKKSWLRNSFGRDYFPSHNFQIVDQGKQLKILGKGYGHGVGLCQLGTLELAKRGYGYRAILQHYFPRFTIKRLW